MATMFLKFTDAAEALALIGIDTPDGRVMPCDGVIDGHYCAIDAVFGTGLIEGRDGYHVNIACPTAETLPTLASYVVEPANPVCVFA